MSNFCNFVGLKKEEAMAVVSELGWQVDTEKDIVIPKETISEEDTQSNKHAVISEEKLRKLTSFVSFLEK